MGVAARADEPVDFARDVAPIFENHCVRCHQSSAPKGDFSLSTHEELAASGYITKGDADDSYLLEVVVKAEGDHRPRMPKSGEPLSNDQVATLRRWIETGATWPDGIELTDKTRASKDWWALRPLSNNVPPRPANLPKGWDENPIDRYIFARLESEGVRPNPPADRRTLIRRATYDLTGLPPTPEEVEQFVNDNSPDAYENLIDRLLESPHYGEHWGRHWLDVVRYGESNGYERNVLINNVWPFRDYVIRSFNEDKPFDRLVIEHLAGDIVGAGDPSVEVGAAFLVCGPYDNVDNFDPIQRAIIRADTIDEIVRATSEAFLGLTFGCARCHDHKFDPITQRDYYALYATLAGVKHGERVVATPEQQKARAEKLTPLEEAKTRLTAELDQLEATILKAAEARAAEFEKLWTRPATSRYLTEDRFEPVEAQYVRLTVLSRDDKPIYNTHFTIDEFEVWTAGDEARNVALASAGAKAAGDYRAAEDFMSAYGVDWVNDGKFEARWVATGSELVITLPKVETIDKVVFSSDRLRALAPNVYPSLFIGDYRLEVSRDGKEWTQVASSADRLPVTPAHRERRLIDLAASDADRERLSTLAAEIAALEEQIAALPAPPTWWVGTPVKAPGPFHVFIGGDPAKHGDEVTPGSPAVLSEVMSTYELPADSPEGERRLQLAKWLVAPENPLTPRVLANRLWHYHFGVGLVDTPSDFGYMGGRPTHPELLDWLARQLHANEWRLKPLHKQIMMSQTYRQASTPRDDGLKSDADSRLLWRFPPRRLAGEEIRDGMLAVAGVLDRTMGGPGFRLYRYLEDNVATYVPLEEHGPETYRRAVYHQTARAARVDLLSDFDCPDPAFAAPRRSSTTTPLQALTLFNHDFTFDMADYVAQRVERAQSAGVADRVRGAFRLVLLRQPEDVELHAAVELVERHGLRALCRALLNANEFLYLN